MKLTIAIPTYNRPTKLCAQLRAVHAQLVDSVEILVVDNASTIAISEIVSKELPELAGKTRFHRNVANIGLAANICRCFEIAEGNWVWTLSDDDEIFPHAVQSILRELEILESTPESIGLNISTSLYQYKDKIVIRGLKEYWKIFSNPQAFSNALFLSSCVFNKEIFRSYLRTTYIQVFSAAPHMAFQIAALLDGKTLSTLNESLVQQRPAEQGSGWDWVAVFSAIPVLAEIPKDMVTQTALSIPLQNFAPGLRFKQALRMLFLDETWGSGFFYIYYSRLVPCLSGGTAAKAMIYRFIAGMTFKFPALKKAMGLVLKAGGYRGEDKIQGLDRL